MTQPEPGLPDLEVRADLQISIDGVQARLVGEGQQLRLETDRPLALLRRVARSGAAVPGGRAALVTAANAASERGLTLVASGPGGSAIHLGGGASSPLARRLIGTPHLRVVTTKAQQAALAAAVAIALVGWVATRRSAS